jgi:hypothetical protein
MPYGHNVTRLIASKMARDAIPAGVGAKRATQAGMSYLASPKLGERTRQAAEWVRQALAAVRAAPAYDPAVHGADDEAIAGEILRRLESRQKGGT